MQTNKNIPGAIIIEGHVQGLSNVRSLGEAGIPVYVLDKYRCIASRSNHCKKFFICPDFVSDEFSDFLILLAKKEGIRDWVLIPSNDHAVYSISRNKNKLEEYFKIITPSYDIIKLIYNKENLLNLAKKLEIPIPITFFDPASLVNTENPEIKFPLITRGKFGLSFYIKTKKKAYIAASPKEFKNQIEEIRNKNALDLAFTQNVIYFNGKNKTISFTAFCLNGEVKAYWMGVKLREHPHIFGTATLSKSVYIPDLILSSKIIIKELNYNGVCEIEYINDPADNKYKLIEINARTWLWVGLAKASGVDFAKMIYNHVNEIKQEFPESYQTGLYWMHIWTDLFFSFTGILKGHYKFIDYIKTLFSPKVFAVFSIKDIKPFIFLTFSLIGYIRKR
jgi:predicted ATP-grasp superfamily ATP-dependent carboligase